MQPNLLFHLILHFCSMCSGHDCSGPHILPSSSCLSQISVLLRNRVVAWSYVHVIKVANFSVLVYFLTRHSYDISVVFLAICQ